MAAANFEDEWFAGRSAELEALYQAGDYSALIAAVLQFSDQEAGRARPLPAWVWPEVVRHLEARFEHPSTGKGTPGPKERTSTFQKQEARWKTVRLCRQMERAGLLNVGWLHEMRRRRNLPRLLRDIPEAGPFAFAEALLRGTGAYAQASTIEKDYYRVERRRRSAV